METCRTAQLADAASPIHRQYHTSRNPDMNCPSCGAEVADNARFCVKCGTPLVSQAVIPGQPESDPILQWILPVGRSGFAIAAGYLALFCPAMIVPLVCEAPLVVIFLIPVLALVFGLLALFDIKKHPDKAGRGRAWFGIVVGGAFTAIGIAAALEA